MCTGRTRLQPRSPRFDHDRIMASIPATIRSMGGIAARRELIRKGHRPDWIEIFWRGGQIERVRQGWYTIPETNPDVKRAWRVGGRLGCASALYFHGARADQPAHLHVNVVRRSARLRWPDDRRVRMADRPVEGVVVHWIDGQSMEETPYSDREAVSPIEALAQTARCPWAASVPRAGATDNL
jgi:hypothetical protein